MKQTLIVFVQDEPGVLNRVASMIRRRNFNIVSIVAGRTEQKKITRMTLVLNEPDKTKQKQVVNNLKALIDVYDVVDVTEVKCHIREYALVKICVDKTYLGDLKLLFLEGHCRVLDQDENAMLIELSGNESNVESAIDILNKHDVLELMRSGKMAMVSGNSEQNKPKLVKSDPNWATQRLLESY